MPPRYLILADGDFGPMTSKTANSVIRFLPGQVVGVLDRDVSKPHVFDEAVRDAWLVVYREPKAHFERSWSRTWPGRAGRRRDPGRSRCTSRSAPASCVGRLGKTRSASAPASIIRPAAATAPRV